MAAELSESDKGKRGALIVVEGLDRAGKSSQCELLYRNLLAMGHQAKYIRFPGTLSTILDLRLDMLQSNTLGRQKHADRQADR